VTNKGCGGIVIKVGNKWVCNACGEEIVIHLKATG